MAIFIVLWPYLLTTKLRCLQKNNIGHTKQRALVLENQTVSVVVRGSGWFVIIVSRAVGRSENLWGAISNVVGIICTPALVEIGSTDLPKYGWGDCSTSLPRFLRLCCMEVDDGDHTHLQQCTVLHCTLVNLTKFCFEIWQKQEAQHCRPP